MDGVFLRLAGLLLKISLGLNPWEIPRSSPASPRKTPSIPFLLLGLTQYIILKDGILRFNSCNITSKRGLYFPVHSLGIIQTSC